eukprot:Polyplicarium_translucidae@DN2503_c0_g1_i1.p1
MMAFTNKRLTAPSVVYDPGGARWVMTLVGDYNINEEARQESDEESLPEFQPTFLYSSDGVTGWTEGGMFIPPESDDEEGIHFRYLSNNFIVPYDDKWLMFGTRNDLAPRVLVGTLNPETAVFEAELTTQGSAFLWDHARSPFPVWGYPGGGSVMMAVQRGAMDTWRPLTLPVQYEATPGHPLWPNTSLFHADWIEPVKSMIWEDAELTRPAVHLTTDAPTVSVLPSGISYDGLYCINATVRSGARDEYGISFYRSVLAGTEDEEDLEIFHLYIRPVYESPQNPNNSRAFHHVGLSGPGMLRSYSLPRSGRSYHALSLIVDSGVVDIRIDGWMIRDRFWPQRGPPNKFLLRGMYTPDGVTFEEGWRFDPVVCPTCSDPPPAGSFPTTSTAPPTVASGAGRPSTAPLVAVASLFVRFVA